MIIDKGHLRNTALEAGTAPTSNRGRSHIHIRKTGDRSRRPYAICHQETDLKPTPAAVKAAAKQQDENNDDD